MSALIGGSQKISSVFDLHSRATSLHERLLDEARSSDADKGVTSCDINQIAALVEAAERLNVINSFNHSARGVVFLRQQRAVMNGTLPLKHIEGESVVGYIRRQAGRCIS